MKGVCIDEDEKEDEFGAFDDIVLNVDMRKFLRTFFGDEWYERTAKAYALDDKESSEWQLAEVESDHPIDLSKERKRLDSQRKKLLDIMTDPNESQPNNKRKKELANIINAFLEEQNRYHPRYLVPNYEAITVFIWHNIWSKEGKKICEDFEKVLEERSFNILNLFKEEKYELGRPWFLLLYKILDIANRLRFSWIQSFIDMNDDEKILSSASRKLDENVDDVMTRIDATIIGVRNART